MTAVDYRAPASVMHRCMTALPAVIRVSLVALFVGTTGCSLVMSANATMTYAASHHVPVGIVWAPVGILELVQVAGTVWWLVSAGWSRFGAVLMVAGTAAVTAVMSCTTYGWLGLIAPVGMVATIHAIACVIRADTGTGTGVNTGNNPGQDRSGPVAVTAVGQVTDDEIRTALRAWAADPQDPGPTIEATRLRFRIGTGRAMRLLREVAS